MGPSWSPKGLPWAPLVTAWAPMGRPWALMGSPGRPMGAKEAPHGHLYVGWGRGPPLRVGGIGLQASTINGFGLNISIGIDKIYEHFIYKMQSDVFK